MDNAQKIVKNSIKSYIHKHTIIKLIIIVIHNVQNTLIQIKKIINTLQFIKQKKKKIHVQHYKVVKILEKIIIQQKILTMMTIKVAYQIVNIQTIYTLMINYVQIHVMTILCMFKQILETKLIISVLMIAEKMKTIFLKYGHIQIVTKENVDKKHNVALLME